MKKSFIIAKVVLLVALFCCILNVEKVKAEDDNKTESNKADSNKVCDGVYFEDVNIGGKTKEEVQSVIEEYQSDLQDKSFEVKVNDKTEDISLDDIGIQLDDKDYANEVINIGYTGNLVQRYKDMADAKQGKKVYKAEITYDTSDLESAINKMSKKCNSKVVEPKLVFSGSAPVVKSGQDGVTVDVDETVEAIKEKLSDWDKKDFSVEAKVDVEKPSVSEEELEECTDVIGEFSTNYSDGDADRNKNIETATKFVNGSCVKPGEVFSIMSKLRPFTVANGYAYGDAYVGDKVKKEIGGGICQVSTTLYNAVLKAEFDNSGITRRCHSGEVHYVPLSQDAMISDGSSDFKFKNTYSTPVYIRGTAGGGTIKFTIYGKETRSSSRKVSFENEVQDLGEGKKAAQLYKVVTENGNTTRTKINESKYSPKTSE